MIDLYYWPTPNGWKVSILLEELGVAYRMIPVHIGKGEQFADDFLRISPNNRIPAIVDHAPADGGGELPLFESGAIMMYLAEKYGRFVPADPRGRFAVAQWVFWQVGGLGPTAGQVHHFRDYAAERIPYAVDRFQNELHRLYGVLEHRLAGRDYIVDEYSIADMACWSWVRLHRQEGIDIAEFPRVEGWLGRLAVRPKLNAGFRLGADLRGGQPTMTEDAKKILLGQR